MYKNYRLTIMKLKEYITASVKPVGSPVMLSKSKVYACDVCPSWSWLKNEVVEANNDITIDAFKTYWTNRYNSKELEYPNIFWAHQDDFVERNIYKDEIGNCFIKLQNGWAPVVSSFKLGQLVFLCTLSTSRHWHVNVALYSLIHGQKSTAEEFNKNNNLMHCGTRPSSHKHYVAN